MDGKEVAASAILLVAVWEVAKAYRETAPSLEDLRENSAHDLSERQQLLDADMTVGGVAVIASVVLRFLSGSYVPGLIVLVTFGWLSLYYHLVQKGPMTNEL